MARTKDILTQDEIDRFLLERNGWSLSDGKLVQDWTFPSFAGAMNFVRKVALLAEEVNHHPDIDIRYNRVRLALISHDAGCLTPRDKAMAEQLDDNFHNQ